MSHLPLSITKRLNETGQVCCFQILDAVFPNDLFSDWKKCLSLIGNWRNFKRDLEITLGGNRMLMNGTTARSVQWPIPINFQGGVS